MDKLGRRLREARKAKGSTLQEAEAATHIRSHFLGQLEAGDFAAFAGGDVQVRGFLRIYARYLDLSPEDVLGHYGAEVHGEAFSAADLERSEAPLEPADPTDDLTAIRFRPRDIPVTSSLPRWMSVRTVMIVGLVLTVLLAILAVATYLMNQPADDQSSVPLTATAPPGMANAPSDVSAAAEPTPTFPFSASGEIVLALEATEHVQVRVRQGGEVLFQQMMAPGQAETWAGDEAIVVETGNGAALQVTINGTALGALCERGQLCARAWGPDGEIAPP